MLGEVEGYQALASESRLKILRLLYKGALSVDDLSRMMNLQPITIRHHLQMLEDAGLIESYEERSGTVGRPKIYYRISKEPQLIGFPKRLYLTLSNFLIVTMQNLLGAELTRKLLYKVGLEMGESTIRKLELEDGIEEWTLERFRDIFIEGYLREAGTEPEIVKEEEKRIIYRIYNCVFFELALKMPEVICDILHEAFDEGVTRAVGGIFRIERLTCMGKGDPYCEHICRLAGKES